ncbi:MAG: hypothetical protein AVDCRST_MAG42-3063 [uncultured Chthoniobacterales bacterium]|uniref:Uncharacterized protein n=1 Tax=uncultured Chthoniobacterales bacterium TaxID=1836801 RepID=A0A6J4J5B6_9BACT|nr:MAG: hypothetical protein AVDCRST_MAG42-3063 [uncultured Chthoniobacterales bacterium]
MFFYGSLLLLVLQVQGIFTTGYDQLPLLLKRIYVGALVFVAAATVLDLTATFLRNAQSARARYLAWDLRPSPHGSSALLVIAMSADVFVAATVILHSATSAFLLVAATWVLLAGIITMVIGRLRRDPS